MAAIRLAISLMLGSGIWIRIVEEVFKPRCRTSRSHVTQLEITMYDLPSVTLCWQIWHSRV